MTFFCAVATRRKRVEKSSKKTVAARTLLLALTVTQRPSVGLCGALCTQFHSNEMEREVDRETERQRERANHIDLLTRRSMWDAHTHTTSQNWCPSRFCRRHIVAAAREKQHKKEEIWVIFFLCSLRSYPSKFGSEDDNNFLNVFSVFISVHLLQSLCACLAGLVCAFSFARALYSSPEPSTD